MTFEYSPALFTGFMFALVRSSAWMAIAPPFNSRIIPVRIKVGLAVALAVVMAPKLPTQDAPLALGPFLGMLLVQIFSGLALGFLTQLLFSAVQAAGSAIDLFGGFSLSSALDPMNNVQTSVFGRMYQLLATTLLFVLNGHLLLIKGFLLTFDAVPLSIPSTANVSAILVKSITLFGIAAIEIAAPLIAALFLAELVLGLLAKAAPQMNVFMLGFPFKILLTISLIGFAIPLLPGATKNLLGDIIHAGEHMMRSFP